MAAARDLQAEMRSGAARGELQRKTTVTFAKYAREWIDTYTGRTSRGLRESTRTGYRQALEGHAIPFFGRMRLVDITPRDIKRFAQAVSDKGLARHGVKNALDPLKALLATAFEDGEIPVNPSSNVRIVLKQAEADEQHLVRALTPTELERFIAEVPDEHRLLVTFLARTGLRIGECVELRWRDVDLVAGSLRVTRSFYRDVVGPPKSRFGIRSIPITPSCARRWSRTS